MQISGETVVATSGKADWDFVALPGNSTTWVPKWGFLTSAPTFDPRFDIGGQFGGWHYGAKAYAGYGGDVLRDGEAKRGPDVNAYSEFAGVLGTGIYVTGVAGTSSFNVGVYGQTGEVPESSIPNYYLAGVLGASSLSWPGVMGWSQGWTGVWGESVEKDGILGVTRSDQANGVVGLCLSYGPWPSPNLPTNAGVLGMAWRQAGVIGTSHQSAGVLGFSNNIGVYGASTNPASYAGFFRGSVRVTDTLTASVKRAVVPFPDGTQRALYCMESPENWFEDFGGAKLKSGRAVVKLDADFAKVIKSGDYRVFVTPEGDCRGLYVRRRSARSFEVHELTGGKSSIAFSYRIVGRRNDIQGHGRFAKIDIREPLPAAAPRAPRKGVPTAPVPRALMVSLGKDARARRAKDAMKARRVRALRNRSRA
jgi:hypothetical protein